MKDNDLITDMYFEKKIIAIANAETSLVLRKVKEKAYMEKHTSQINKLRQFIQKQQKPISFIEVTNNYEEFGYANIQACSSALNRELKSDSYLYDESKKTIICANQT